MIILTKRAVRKVLNDRKLINEIAEEGKKIVFPVNLLKTMEPEEVLDVLSIKEIELVEARKKTPLGFLNDDELEVAKVIESNKKDENLVVYLEDNSGLKPWFEFKEFLEKSLQARRKGIKLRICISKVMTCNFSKKA